MRTFEEVLCDEERDWRHDNLPITAACMLGRTWYKPFVHDLMVGLGVDTPYLYACNVSAAEAIRVVKQQESCVIKPVTGSGNRGVHLIQKQGRKYHDVYTGIPVVMEELKNNMRACVKSMKSGMQDRWVVEEYMHQTMKDHSRASDTKIYCFYGDPQMIMRRKMLLEEGKPVKRYQFFDTDGSTTETGMTNYITSDEVGLPKDVDAVLKFASEVSLLLPVPFMRIDLYESYRGIVVGGLARTPGQRKHLTDYWNNRFVDAWDRAKHRLTTDIRSGALRDSLTICEAIGRLHVLPSDGLPSY